MASNKNLLLLPGDGIGPEVLREVRRLIDWLDRRRRVSFDVAEGLVGGASYDAHGTPLTDSTLDLAMNSDAVLLGAVGGPKWDGLDFADKPERGLLRLRKEMDLFANLRPAFCFDALVEASTLKPEVVRGLDIMIVRELTGGIYFGEPRGVETLADGYSRVSGRHGVCIGQNGPGITNFVTAVAAAYWAHSPVVAITAVRPEARARPAAPAQGDGPLRQPAPGDLLRCPGRGLDAETRGGLGPRYHDWRGSRWTPASIGNAAIESCACTR